MNAFTSLIAIKGWTPCVTGYQKLLHNLGKTVADDEPLSMRTILDSNGLEDAVWAIRALDAIEYDARLFAVNITGRAIVSIHDDPVLLQAFKAVKAFALGEIGRGALDVALEPLTLAPYMQVVNVTPQSFMARAVKLCAEQWVGPACYHILIAIRNGFYSLPREHGNILWQDTALHEDIRDEFVRRFCTP